MAVSNQQVKKHKVKVITKECVMCKRELSYDSFFQDFDDIEAICMECEEELKYQGEWL